MDQISDQENKGQYCQFVRTADGSYILKPVKVPAHVKEARAERIRQREIRRQVEENRRRAQAITKGSLLVMTLTLSLFVVICCLFLNLQNRMNNRMDRIAALQTQVEQLSEDNETLKKRLTASENLAVIEEIAVNKLGMRTPGAGQILYYQESPEDYMLQYQDISDDE